MTRTHGLLARPDGTLPALLRLPQRLPHVRVPRRDLLDDLAVGIGGGDFCARVQLVLDGVEVKLTADPREGLAVGTTGLGGQLEAARQIDDAAADSDTHTRLSNLSQI